MMYCPACGHQMHESATACPNCGRPNSNAPGPAPTVAATVAPLVPDVQSGWFSFEGRIRRKDFWLRYVLPILVVNFIVAFIDAAAGAQNVLVGLVSLILLVPNLAGTIKRLHDRDRSGWFIFIILIPVIGGIWLLIEVGFLAGTPGPNRFGHDPLHHVRTGYSPAAA